MVVSEHPGGGGLKGGQKNALDLSMSDVVTSMGDMGGGGDHTKRENPCQRIATMQILINNVQGINRDGDCCIQVRQQT